MKVDNYRSFFQPSLLVDSKFTPSANFRESELLQVLLAFCGFNGAYVLSLDFKKVVMIFPSIDAANAAACILTADGIETAITSDDSEGEFSRLQVQTGVRLLVKVVDEFRARRLLALALPMTEKLDEEDLQPVTEGLLKRSRRRAPFIAGLLFVVLFVIPLIIALIMALGGF